ncbi:MAG TPA: MMPL family transporter, partial [Polyangia bacterium]|nr:MMPL family transporter [Polyangia bacterium]
DLTAATAICLLGVLGVIFLYFRRVAVLWVVGAPAVLGLLLALALAASTVRYLNLNTAFLASIILGNGINSPILVMARFGEERRAGRAVHDALVRALTESFTGTLTAMAAAAIAYGSLLATSFRGFNQFGIIGGAGMLLVWLATFALVPPMVIAGERLRAGVLTPPSSWARPLFAALGRAVERRPIAAALLIAAACASLARPVARWLRDPLEWNFENLRTEATPAQKLWHRMESLGMGDVGAGRVGNDGVFLVDDPAQAEPVAEAVRQKDAADPSLRLIKTVRTMRSLFPWDEQKKLALLARVRSKLDKHMRLLDEDEARELLAWRPRDDLRAVTVDDLPRVWLDAFTETDGQRGRFVGVDADRARYYSNNGHDLLRLSRALEVDALGRRFIAASVGTIFAGMLRAIVDDGPRVTLLALAGVTALVLLMFGPRGALPVLAALALGLYWLVGALGVEQTKLNFMNFVALPITLGVGADYAANIWARLKRDPGAALGDVFGGTGSAVALCSLTTIIGYSTLLMSRNHALRSFGVVADLGELTCLAAALIAMPVLVRIFRRS